MQSGLPKEPEIFNWMKWALFMEMRGRRITSRITGVLRIDMLLRKIVVLLLLIPTFHALRAQPVVEKKYEWHQQGFYILNPAFAHRNQELVFVRQRSGKDSSNQVAGFTATELVCRSCEGGVNRCQ